MKTKIFVAMTSSLLASVALAQGSATSTTSGASTAKAAPSTAPAATRTSAPGVSTASIADNSPKGLQRFSLLFMNETEFAPAEGVEKDVNPPVSGLNRFQVGYALSDTKKITFREDSTFKSPKNKPTEYHISDPFIAYTDTKFAELPGGWVLTVQPRLYLPFGETARFQTNAKGGEALALIIDKSVGRFDLELLALGAYMNNTQDFYYDYDATKGTYKSKGVMDWWTQAVAEVAYNITDKLSVQHELIHWTRSYRRNDLGLSSASTLLINETGVSYKFVKQFSMVASIENDMVFDNASEAKFYQNEDMLYNVYFKLNL